MTTENASLITITDAATNKLKEILDEQGTPTAFLRITVAPGGHGGAQYILGLEEQAEEEDTVVQSGPVNVLLDADSATLMDGTNIDYLESMQRSGFVISNPNFAAGGCGEGGCACGGGGCGCGGH